jgi:hypothetical protein
MHSMLVPVLVSAVGFFITGIFSFAFSDLAVIPGPIQSWMVIVGSALIIFGAELNTPFTTIEVFRKILRQEANAWDTSALVVSLVGTVVNLLVTFASRLVLNAAWQGLLLNWGPLLAGFAVACDYYGALVELGFLFGSYEMRMESWLAEKRAWEQAMQPAVEMAGARDGKLPGSPTVGELGVKSAWATARIEDFQRVRDRLNGRQGLLDVELLEAELARDRLQLPSRSTVRRWLKMAQSRERVLEPV